MNLQNSNIVLAQFTCRLTWRVLILMVFQAKWKNCLMSEIVTFYEWVACMSNNYVIIDQCCFFVFFSCSLLINVFFENVRHQETLKPELHTWSLQRFFPLPDFRNFWPLFSSRYLLINLDYLPGLYWKNNCIDLVPCCTCLLFTLVRLVA